MFVAERFLVELEGEGCFLGVADDMEVGEHIFLTAMLHHNAGPKGSFVLIGGQGLRGTPHTGTRHVQRVIRHHRSFRVRKLRRNDTYAVPQSLRGRRHPYT